MIDIEQAYEAWKNSFLSSDPINLIPRKAGFIGGFLAGIAAKREQAEKLSDEATALLVRITKYAREDRATTPRVTRLARVLAESETFLSRSTAQPAEPDHEPNQDCVMLGCPGVVPEPTLLERIEAEIPPSDVLDADTDGMRSFEIEQMQDGRRCIRGLLSSARGAQ